MKQRLLLCLLLIGVMLYYAVPRISPTAEGMEGLFASSWLLLTMFAAAGNLTGMLYAPKKRKKGVQRKEEQVRQRIHYYH
ncbi:hypothetical protein [Bacillus sp. V5-8f]|uniref:hypothetical protein n=1 Tax=Bacillus sp. V5-8f TaxID=2053044 RepID=UPI000C773B99|nr:hypothetical protein [Bacillus sp. V5-8f]PLT32293.1 hypothetical protein CUU64_19510 [Bacillus sp. V5-8f]